jgi:hypothetical protein
MNSRSSPEFSLNWIFFPPKSLTAILWEHVFEKILFGAKKATLLDTVTS